MIQVRAYGALDESSIVAGTINLQVIELSPQPIQGYLLDMTDATRTEITALDSDGEEFALDFGFPAVSTARELAPASDADTTDGRAALDDRKGRNAAWRDANLVPTAKPRG